MQGRLFVLLLEEEQTDDGKHTVKDLKVEQLGEVMNLHLATAMLLD
jgi:hypothetical protein